VALPNPKIMRKCKTVQIFICKNNLSRVPPWLFLTQMLKELNHVKAIARMHPAWLNTQRLVAISSFRAKKFFCQKKPRGDPRQIVFAHENLDGFTFCALSWDRVK